MPFLKKTARGPHLRRGVTLMEIMVTITIIGVLVGMAIPRFGRTIEQSKADFAVANLRAIWAAQRLYWLEHHTYNSNLSSAEPPGLFELGLLDPAIVSNSGDYLYEITAAGSSSFQATATRTAGTIWSGEFTISESGTVSGSISATGEATITPGFQ